VPPPIPGFLSRTDIYATAPTSSIPPVRFFSFLVPHLGFSCRRPPPFFPASFILSSGRLGCSISPLVLLISLDQRPARNQDQLLYFHDFLRPSSRKSPFHTFPSAHFFGVWFGGYLAHLSFLSFSVRDEPRPWSGCRSITQHHCCCAYGRRML